MGGTDATETFELDRCMTHLLAALHLSLRTVILYMVNIHWGRQLIADGLCRSIRKRIYKPMLHCSESKIIPR